MVDPTGDYMAGDLIAAGVPSPRTSRAETLRDWAAWLRKGRNLTTDDRKTIAWLLDRAAAAMKLAAIRAKEMHDGE